MSDQKRQTKFEQLVADALPAPGELIGFEGDDNCDGSCGGWDGVSSRCECGARRVEWTSDVGCFYVYGEAY